MRKILDQSSPFKAEKSESVYRLIEQDGKRFIEKTTTTVSVERDVPSDVDSSTLFRDFLSAKRANRSRNKSRISVEDAFIRHHVHGQSWQQIADEVGQKSGASIGKRVSEFTRGLASDYLGGEPIYQRAEDLNMSANHLNMILIGALERERSRLLFYYEEGNVMRGYERDVAKIAQITDFLNDWGQFEYEIVSPFGEGKDSVSAGKKTLYSEDFYEIHRESGKSVRIAVDDLDGIAYHNWNSSPLVEAFGLITNDPVTKVIDMFGNESKYYTQRLQTPEPEC